MKIVTVVGARPQFVKAAVVTRLLGTRRGAQEVLVHTGQHYDENMSNVFFSELGITAPHYNLSVGSGAHGQMTGRMLEGIEQVLLTERPDWVLVYGDTNSTLAGALAAAKLHIPVAHVEAGLRSFNRRMPEEINRVLTDHISALLFAPTNASVTNLAAEGITGAVVRQVGDIMYDAVLHFRDMVQNPALILAEHRLRPGGYVLVTIHRAENTDDLERLRVIVEGLCRAAREHSVIWPVHPRARAALERSGLNAALDGTVKLVPPVGYLDMIALERSARLIVTDSGGVQKEAFFFGVPCVTLRVETEWIELVALGANRLVPPTDVGALAAAIGDVRPFPTIQDRPYGDGRSGERIVDALIGG